MLLRPGNTSLRKLCSSTAEFTEVICSYKTPKIIYKTITNESQESESES